ncbi:MAG: TatD family hydrolase [Clostridia bacterium]|nr:TatD family hydrolase [Clostridia bacterium]
MNNEKLSAVGIFDTHAHYFDRRFENETEGADTVLERDVFGAGIDGVINVGTNNSNSRLCIEMAKKYDKMYVAAGIHPEDIRDITSTPEQECARLAELFADRSNKVVALGEIGLDYHYEGFDKELQKRYFELQMDMAVQLDMPVVVHDREAHGDCFDMIMRFPRARGVFHSFSGSAEMAKELVRRGWYISFSGVLTFKNARKTVEAAAQIPSDMILIETDAPYLAPHPHRGKINHSGLMVHTAERFAEIRGISFDEAVALTRKNTKDLFGV